MVRVDRTMLMLMHPSSIPFSDLPDILNTIDDSRDTIMSDR